MFKPSKSRPFPFKTPIRRPTAPIEAPAPAKWRLVQQRRLFCLATWHLRDLLACPRKLVHPGKLTWNLEITCLKRKIIFQTFIFGFHVNFQGCKRLVSGLYPQYIPLQLVYNPFTNLLGHPSNGLEVVLISNSNGWCFCLHRFIYLVGWCGKTLTHNYPHYIHIIANV